MNDAVKILLDALAAARAWQAEAIEGRDEAKTVLTNRTAEVALANKRVAELREALDTLSPATEPEVSE